VFALEGSQLINPRHKGGGYEMANAIEFLRPALPYTISLLLIIITFVLTAVVLYRLYRPAQTLLHSRALYDERFAYLELARRERELAKREIERDESSSKKLAAIVEEKKNKFINTPSRSFHFANGEQIRSFYSDYFKEPTIASLINEMTGELSADIKGTIPQLLEAKLGGKDISKWVSTIKLPDISLSGMFLRYQRETIKSNQVVLGIEEVEIELNELQAFDSMVKTLNERFGFNLEDGTLATHRTRLKEKAAERTLVKLEQATGWVLVEGRFKIDKMEDFYRCTYLHPVGEYLSKQATPVTISILLPIESVEPSFAGNYAESVGKTIPLKVYGQVWQPVDRKSRVWELQLTPLAVY